MISIDPPSSPAGGSSRGPPERRPTCGPPERRPRYGPPERRPTCGSRRLSRAIAAWLALARPTWSSTPHPPAEGFAAAAATTALLPYQGTSGFLAGQDL